MIEAQSEDYVHWPRWLHADHSSFTCSIRCFHDRIVSLFSFLRDLKRYSWVDKLFLIDITTFRGEKQGFKHLNRDAVIAEVLIVWQKKGLFESKSELYLCLFDIFNLPLEFYSILFIIFILIVCLVCCLPNINLENEVPNLFILKSYFESFMMDRKICIKTELSVCV